MTPDDYRKSRLKLGLTQTALAELVGVWRETISKREAGTLPISRESELALEALEKQTTRKQRP